MRAPGDWGAKGACVKVQVTMADTVPSGNGSKPNQAALNVCFGCGVRQECLDWALEGREDPCAGQIVGGVTSFDRRKMRHAGL